MAHPSGESGTGDLRVDFDRRVRLEFRGAELSSDGGLLAFRELDDALGLSVLAGAMCLGQWWRAIAATRSSAATLFADSIEQRHAANRRKNRYEI